MFILYYKPSCPFCQRVLQVAENLGISFDLKDISEDSALADELIARGGKRMVPYLVNTKHGIEMYESQDIIDYIKTHKDETGSSVSKPRIHRSNETCVACEG